jgi:hypothetical protein
LDTPQKTLSRGINNRGRRVNAKSLAFNPNDYVKDDDDTHAILEAIRASILDMDDNGVGGRGKWQQQQ